MSAYHDIAVAQFENINCMRRYPFSDSSTLECRDGKTLPEDVISDIHLMLPFWKDAGASGFDGGGMPEVCLSSVHLSPYMVSACFVSKISGKPVQALSVTVSAANFKPYVPYMLEKLHGSEDAGGAVTFGDMSFPGFPETYFLENAEIHPCCISPSRPAKLRKFVDRRSGGTVSGDAEIEFSGYVSASRSGKSVTLSLQPGAESELASGCAEDPRNNACGATPIISINGVHPDEHGNIVLWFH